MSQTTMWNQNIFLPPVLNAELNGSRSDHLCITLLNFTVL